MELAIFIIGMVVIFLLGIFIGLVCGKHNALYDIGYSNGYEDAVNDMSEKGV